MHGSRFVVAGQAAVIRYVDCICYSKYVVGFGCLNGEGVWTFVTDIGRM